MPESPVELDGVMEKGSGVQEKSLNTFIGPAPATGTARPVSKLAKWARRQPKA